MNKKTKYIDVVIQPVPKKHLAAYRKTTSIVGKVLLKHGALGSSDFVAEDENATKLYFPKKIKLKAGEVLIIAFAEFKSKAHREKVFKLMHKDPAMAKLSEADMHGDHKRMLMGGFKVIVNF